MKNTSTFSIRRLTLLMGRDVYTNLKYYLTFFATLGGILITVSLLNTWANNGEYDTSFLLTQGQLMLFLFGLVITSTTFKELHSNNRGWFYLMLPANPLEKLLSNWLITSVGYAVAASLLLVVSSLVSSVFAVLLFGENLYIINPLEPNFLQFLLHYCIIQSVFFLGAIYFKKYHFLKTILALFILFFTFIIVIALISRGIFQTWSISSDQFDIDETTILGSNLLIAIKTLYYALMVPFFLTVSYFKFKEKEV